MRLEVCEAQDDKIGMNGAFRCFGIVYRLKEEWDKAVESFNKSILILEMLDIPYEQGDAYFELGKTYEVMGENMAAIDNLSMAKQLFDTVGAKTEAKAVEEKIASLEGK